jgi:hypothetical protein
MSKRVLSQVEQVRAWGLLDMLYQPSEIADEIGCDAQRIYRVLIPAGCPHQRDELGHIWIHGATFRDWANRTLSRDVDKLAEGQAYCLRCRVAVQMVGSEIKAVSRSVERVVGTCPACGAVVNRMRARGAA